MSGRSQITALDLFCGAGGSSWGAHRAGVDVVAGFDKWEVAGRVYKQNISAARFFNRDLNAVNPNEVLAEIGHVDLILASPECTNHSPAKGAAARCEKSRSTAFHVVRFAKAFRPRWIVIENVVSMKKWHRYAEFLACLRGMGYRLQALTLNAADYGVPQSRRRLFILCDREREPCERVSGARKPKNVRDIIDSNGTYPFSPLRAPRRAKATLLRAERAIAELGRREPFLIVYYGSDSAGGWQPLDRPLRTITTLDRFAFVKPSPKGHVMRMLQPEELKRAMGWPKRFQIEYGTRRDRIKMIGNAVCPVVMQRVVEALCRP